MSVLNIFASSVEGVAALDSSKQVLIHSASSSDSALPNFGSMLFQVGGTLVLIVGLILLLAWLSKRFALPGVGGPNRLVLKSSLMLGRKEKLVIVEVEGQRLLLGVCEAQVQLIKELPESDPLPSSTPTEEPEETLLARQSQKPKSGEFSGFLQSVLENRRASGVR